MQTPPWLISVPAVAVCAVVAMGCGATGRSARRLPASAEPYLGVACGVANWTGCDRVRVGVHLALRATRVTVSIDGRLVSLHAPSDPGNDLWEGVLRHAGLRHGPLAIRPPDSGGYWYGSPAVNARVRVTAYLANGTRATRADTDLLHPGYG